MLSFLTNRQDINATAYIFTEVSSEWLIYFMLPFNQYCSNVALHVPPPRVHLTLSLMTSEYWPCVLHTQIQVHKRSKFNETLTVCTACGDFLCLSLLCQYIFSKLWTTETANWTAIRAVVCRRSYFSCTYQKQKQRVRRSAWTLCIT